MSNFSFFQPGTKSARSLDCRPVHDGGRMNENKENEGREGGEGVQTKHLKKNYSLLEPVFLLHTNERAGQEVNAACY